MTEASTARAAELKTPWGLVLVLGGLSAFAPLSVDMYLPGLPQMVVALGATASQGAWSVAAFFVGMCVGQLAYGPLSDRVGRRPPLLAGILLYVLATLGCAFAPSIWVMILMRFLQALGGCAGVVIARAIVRDRFKPHETAHVFSLLMVVMSIAPIVAPLLGGFVLMVADWRGIFSILTAFGAAVGVAAFLGMKESRPAWVAEHARGETVARAYVALVREPRVMGYALAAGCAQAGLLTYVATAPDVIIRGFHVSPQGFGWVFSTNGLGLVLSNGLNRRLLRRHSYDRILRRANMASIGLSAVLLLDALTGFGGFWGVILPLFALVAGMGFTQANAMAGAMAVDPHRAGSTSALTGFMQFAMAACASSIAGAFQDGSARPMAAVILCAYLLSGLALRTLARPG